MGMCAITFCTPCFCIGGCGCAGGCAIPQGQCCCCVDKTTEVRLLKLQVERYRTLQIIETSIGAFLSLIGWALFILVYTRCYALDSLSSGVCWSSQGGQSWDVSVGTGFWAAVGVGVGTPLFAHGAIGLCISNGKLQQLQERQSARWKEVGMSVTEAV